jgi:translation initiation factor IF-2
LAATSKKAVAQKKAVELPPELSVHELSELMGVTPVSLIKQLMRGGVMANINQTLDFQMAGRLAASFGYEVRMKPAVKRHVNKRQTFDEVGVTLKSRPPVVTIMGHVDHGKTRILDAIRQTSVMESEAGGITQHIGAYQVVVDGQKITFLDTPGHEAFTTMRARGANMTDMAVLVVAADDGVMPQTLEAIDHAKAAGVPILVAMNKMDKDNANPDRVKQQLAEADLLIEEWGGEVISIPTSAKNNEGIDKLLESILLISEMEDLKTDPRQPTGGVVIESSMDKQKGPMATVLVQSGILRVGDIAVIGTTWGKIKAMYNYTGKQIKKAGPSTPAQILGLESVAQVGDLLKTTSTEQQARGTVQKRLDALKEQRHSSRLQNIMDQINAGKIKDFSLVLKADVQGSIEPIKTSLEQLSNDNVKVRVVHSGTGNITGTDVMLAATASGFVAGFNVTAETGAKRVAEVEGVDIRSYAVIYDVIDDVTNILKGMAEPTYVDVIDGHAEIRNIFSTSKKGRIAGVYVTEGKITRSGKVRVLRGKENLGETTVASLKRFKDDASEVAAGYECGVGLVDFADFEENDILEFFHREAKYAA